jgi:peptidoglycan/LPS O-acetylase OafA/YrhL
MKDRIAFLDGHRGLAILLVVGFHAFSRWPTHIPNGDCCGRFPIFELGWLGVELFFMLSGFVILMTLDRCGRAADFFRGRWLRLFPAMLVCSLIIYCSAPLFRERPAGAPEFDSLLPGLTFMDLGWLQQLFRHPIPPLEGSFWSLYVEVKFYVFAALVYFRFGREALLKSLVGLATFTLCVRLLHQASSISLVSDLDGLLQDLGFDYWFWFAGGAAYYMYRQTGRTEWVRLALCCFVGGSCVLDAAHQYHWMDVAGGIAIGAFFAVSMHSEHVQAALRNRLLQFLGFVSYPLYLLHENMLVASLIKIAPRLPRHFFPLLPLLLLAPLAALAFLVARYAEPALKRRLAQMLARLWPSVFRPKVDPVHVPPSGARMP